MKSSNSSTVVCVTLSVRKTIFKANFTLRSEMSTRWKKVKTWHCQCLFSTVSLETSMRSYRKKRRRRSKGRLKGSNNRLMHKLSLTRVQAPSQVKSWQVVTKRGFRLDVWNLKNLFFLSSIITRCLKLFWPISSRSWRRSSRETCT